LPEERAESCRFIFSQQGFYKTPGLNAKELEVIKRDDRLDAIAQHIVYHFPRRGFRGKGMVISVDKFTTVKMYDKVSFYWKEEIKSLTSRFR
jgi:type I restriction enzyme R subunit